MSKITIVRDSSQIDAFLMCPQYWKYRYDEHLLPSDMPEGSSKAMMMGTFGHSILEVYYRQLSMWESHAEAIDTALSFDSLDLGLVEREVVRQRCREYFYSHLSNDIVPESPDHIEVGFSELLYEDCERIYVLEGRIDLIGQLGGLKAVMDHKFQLREKSLYKKSIQFRNYAMVTHAPMLILNMIRLAKGITNSTFERPIASFTEFEHQSWKRRLIDIYHKMYEAQTLRERYDKNESACSGKYGYECDYTRLCEELNPDLVQPIKNTLYRIGEEWKPW